MTAPRTAYHAPAPLPPDVRRREPTVTHEYRDAAGRLVFNKRRYDWVKEGKPHKAFEFGCFVDHKWRSGLDGVQRVLFRLPELKGAEHVFLCEGESDALAVVKAGGAATTNPCGALEPWRTAYSVQLALAGVKQVTIIADRDGPAGAYVGEHRAQRLQKALIEAGFVAEVKQPATGKDVRDHLTAGKRLADLEPFVAPPAVDGSRIRSLADYLKDPDALKPPPAVIPRLAWRGLITLYAAPEGWGKSTHARAGCAAVTTGQGFLDGTPIPPADVLWCRLEEPESLCMIGAYRFHTDPNRFLVWTPGDDPVAELVAAIRERRPAITVVDSVHELAVLAGVEKLDDAAQVGHALAPLVSVTHETDTAMLWLGQANKASGRYRNSSWLGHAADIVFELREPDLTQPRREVLLKKSRIDMRGYALELVNDAYRLVVGESGATDLGPLISKERRRILGALKPSMGWAEWLTAYGGNKDTFSSGVRWLRAHEYIRQDEERGTWSPNQFTVEQARAA